MADPRFYSNRGPFSIAQIVECCGGKLVENPDNKRMLSDVSALTSAEIHEVAFVDNRRYASELENTQAGLLLLPSDLAGRAPSNSIVVECDNAYDAFAKIAESFYPEASVSCFESSNTAISNKAKIGINVSISPGVVINDDAVIGSGCFIGANTTIGRAVIIGENTWIGPNSTLCYCIIGDSNIIHTGVRIGQDGYGFSPGFPSHRKVPQLGRVLIGDNVEIGANSCIDRGSLLDTEIGSGTKIDNLVQIAHNVRIGSGCLFAGQVGVAGSTSIGDYVMIGGQTAITGHINIGDRVQIGGKSSVTKDLESGKKVLGNPAVDARLQWTRLATLNKLAKRKK